MSGASIRPRGVSIRRARGTEPAVGDFEIVVEIPAEQRFVALSRVCAASRAIEAGFDVDDVEELRIGVNELVSLLVESVEARQDTPHASQTHQASQTPQTLRLEFTVTPDEVKVRGCIVGHLGTPEPDALAAQILSVVVDRYWVSPGAFGLSKMSSNAGRHTRDE